VTTGRGRPPVPGHIPHRARGTDLATAVAWRLRPSTDRTGSQLGRAVLVGRAEYDGRAGFYTPAGSGSPAEVLQGGLAGRPGT